MKNIGTIVIIGLLVWWLTQRQKEAQAAAFEELTPEQESRRQEWKSTLVSQEGATMPAEGTAWYRYIMYNEPLPGRTRILEISEYEKLHTKMPITKYVEKQIPVYSTIEDWEEAHG